MRRNVEGYRAALGARWREAREAAEPAADVAP
jgi:hypothetical protein